MQRWRPRSVALRPAALSEQGALRPAVPRSLVVTRRVWGVPAVRSPRSFSGVCLAPRVGKHAVCVLTRGLQLHMPRPTVSAGCTTASARARVAAAGAAGCSKII